jgi:hypothetical protein
LALILASAFFVGNAQAEPPVEPACEAHATPGLGMSCGDHKLDLKLTSRYRAELWSGFNGFNDNFHALRTRIGAKYSYQDAVTLFAEFQDARIYDLGTNTSGAGVPYKTFGGGGDPSKASTQDMRQYWLELKPIKGLSLSGGRRDIKLGTQAMYKEAAWKYVKVKRASQRLVGTVGWTNVERSNDAFVGAYDSGDYHFYGFAGKPTTGVFDHAIGYETQKDIVYGGISVTAKRGTWFENTEIRPFFLGYKDDRPVAQGGLALPVEVYTLGASAIGIYPTDCGNFDVLLWGAGQAGDYNGADHLAYALIGEFGYQMTDVWSAPWIRLGVNFASGDGTAGGNHNTFFNLLPTNHLYYGFADQLAFQNLVDIVAQLMFKPHPRVGVNVMFHQFYLAKSQDAQYFGTGAFNKTIFGYGAIASGGDKNFGQELDLGINIKVHDHVSVGGGYTHMWGRDVIRNQVGAGARGRTNLDFGYLQIVVSY